MSGFKGSYLRVLTPKTTDGVTLMYDSEGKVAYKESHQANTRNARNFFEKQNAKLAHVPHLRHIVEVVGGDEEEMVKAEKNPQPSEKAQVKKPAPVAKKGGPQPNPGAEIVTK